MYLILRNHMINTAQCPITVTDEKTQSWSVETVCGEKHGRGSDPELYKALQFVITTVLPLIQPTDATVIDVLDAYEQRESYYEAKELVTLANKANQQKARDAVAQHRATALAADAVKQPATDWAGAKVIPFPQPAGDSPAAIPPSIKPVVPSGGLKPIVPKEPHKDPA